MRLRTTNHNRLRALRRRVYVEALAFHERRVARLSKSGTLHKLKDSGYVRRLRSRSWAQWEYEQLS